MSAFHLKFTLLFERLWKCQKKKNVLIESWNRKSLGNCNTNNRLLCECVVSIWLVFISSIDFYAVLLSVSLAHTSYPSAPWCIASHSISLFSVDAYQITIKRREKKTHSCCYCSSECHVIATQLLIIIDSFTFGYGITLIQTRWESISVRRKANILIFLERNSEITIKVHRIHVLFIDVIP